MKTVVIYEAGGVHIPDSTFVLDLNAREIRDCTGCWSCWKKTPGRCAFHDLDDFYAAFLQADRVVLFAGVSCDFVSGRMKTLFDRMIPHYLPYTSYKTGESMHVPRYDRYPDIEVYYQDTFSSHEARQLYEEYLARVFYQFHVKRTLIKPADAYVQGGIAI